MIPVVRDPDDSKVLGLCAAIAKSLDVDPFLVRLIVCFLTLVTGIIFGVLTYAVGGLLAPKKS